MGGTVVRVWLEFGFWIGAAALFHSYIFFPFLLRLLAAGKKGNVLVYEREEDLPRVSVLMAVFNEEQVIREKIEKLFASTYPRDKLEVWIGSDASTDGTEAAIRSAQARHPGLQLRIFGQRMGKPKILNELANAAQGDLFWITDANVMPEPDMLFQLVKHFRNPEIGLVDGRMLHRELREEGIAVQESAYLAREVAIKHREGLIWGAMMGPFGGCFVLRASLFRPIPSNFIVDDFFLCMQVLEQGKRCISEPEACCREDVSQELSEEFRRKLRISAGNFQNLRAFRKLLWPPFRGLAFSFWSHKVLRWFGPYFLSLSYLCILSLAHESLFFRWAFVLQTVCMTVPFTDYAMQKAGIHLRPLRFLTYFYLMNLALLMGSWKYPKGAKSNIWKPTKRNQ